MEIRIWLPESWSAFRYMVRHPRSWIIGAYGFDRWNEEHQRFMRERSQRQAAERKLDTANQKLKKLGKELSEYKRSNTETSRLLGRILELEEELRNRSEFIDD